MQKILLFGKNGFIGHNVLDFWSQNTEYEVVAPSSSECDLLNEDQTKNFISQTQPDFIINAAYMGVSSTTSYSDEYVFNNLKIVSHILRGSAEAKNLKKIFTFGSGLEYGESEQPITEEFPVKPKNVYATVKALSSLLSLNIAQELKLPVVVLRPFNLYGRYDNKSVVYYIVSSILQKKELSITKGEQTRDYLYIGDLAQMINQCVHKYDQLPNLSIYNLGSGKPTQLSKIYDTIFQQLQFTGEVKFKEYHPNEYWHTIADISKVQNIIHCEKFTELEEGIRQTIGWVKETSQT
jgi:nucleoside-diphosphate-sugar epimerase